MDRGTEALLWGEKKKKRKKSGLCVVKTEKISICEPEDEYSLMRRNKGAV